MHKALQVLVAIAALVVILAGGAYLLELSQEAEERAALEAEEAAQAQFRSEIWAEIQRAKMQAEIDQCATDLSSYDNGNSAAFVARAIADGGTLTGDTMAAEVDKCRALVGG